MNINANTSIHIPSFLVKKRKEGKTRVWSLPRTSLSSLSPSCSFQEKEGKRMVGPSSYLPFSFSFLARKNGTRKESGGEMLPLPSLSPSFPCQGKEGKIGGRVLNKMGLINASLITINSNVHLEISTNIHN